MCRVKIGKSWQMRSTVNVNNELAEMASDILTLEDVSIYFKAGTRTVYCSVDEGKGPAFKLGGSWRFRRSDLFNWITANLNGTSTSD